MPAGGVRAGVGEPITGGVGVAVRVAVADGGVPVGVDVAPGPGVDVPDVGDTVAVAGTEDDVAVGVAVDGADGAMTFVTVAVQVSNAPPPFAEPLHWSM